MDAGRDASPGRAETTRTPRSRGVRLSDLDRGLVYRIAYVGRRWEVLGPEDSPGAGAPLGPGGASAGAGGASTAPPAPRHAGPAEFAG